MPEYERLQPVTENLNAPTAVAIDINENIYITESINNKLLIFSQSGQYLETLSGLNKPVSVAVDSNGRIFIGNKNSGNVEAYDADLNFLFKLGTGDEEFSLPGAIAIDSEENIYVADIAEDMIKVYNPDGSFNFSFGSSGSGDGEFNFPTSIAINETAGELVILDRQLTESMYGGEFAGARVQVFDMNGIFKRSFGEFGAGEGFIARPMGVAVDNEGRIYVTDAQQHVVHVFEGNGTFLGTVFNLDNPMRTPLGITMGKSSRLFIASLNTRKVEVYGIGQSIQMEVTPLSLTFEGQQNSSAPALQAVEIRNNGSGAFNWTAESGDSWITLSGITGSLEPSAVSTVNVGVNLNGLTAGTYRGSVGVSAEAGATEIIDVQLTVTGASQLFVNPSALEFASQNGSIPSSQSLSIENTGAGTLNWTATSDKGWIVIDKEGGAAPDSIGVSVDITSMGAGTHTGEITINGGGSVIVPVTLNIISTKGTIHVTTNLAEATFTINGAGSYTGNGTSWTVEDALTGTYAIIFGEVAGYTTPLTQSNTLEAGGTINFTGEYAKEEEVQAEVNRYIVVGAGPGKKNNAIVKVVKSNGEGVTRFQAFTYKYGVNVATGDINSDGVDEIIAAPGPGPKNRSQVRVFNLQGNRHGRLTINAFNRYKYGATVATGDFNGDGYHEVVVGAGPNNPAYVKVYMYDAENSRMRGSGIMLLAYGKGFRNGVKVAVGDVDGDGKDELITALGPGETNRGIVKIWEVKTSGGVGKWRTKLLKTYKMPSRYCYNLSIATGDIDNDGVEEVVVGAGSNKKKKSIVRIYGANGIKRSVFKALRIQYGVNVASGDMDDDGVAEVVIGAGANKGKKGIVQVYDTDGTIEARFKALNTRYGVNIAIGDFGAGK
jgi:hypothetical protein